MKHALCGRSPGILDGQIWKNPIQSNLTVPPLLIDKGSSSLTEPMEWVVEELPPWAVRINPVIAFIIWSTRATCFLQRLTMLLYSFLKNIKQFSLENHDPPYIYIYVLLSIVLFYKGIDMKWYLVQY